MISVCVYLIYNGPDALSDGSGRVFEFQSYVAATEQLKIVQNEFPKATVQEVCITSMD